MTLAILDTNGHHVKSMQTDNPRIFAGGDLPELYRNKDGIITNIFSWKEWLPQASHKLSLSDGGIRTITHRKATAYLRIGTVTGHSNAVEISVTSPDYDDFLSIIDMVTEYVGGKVISMPKKDDQSMVLGIRNDMRRLKGYLMTRLHSLRQRIISAAY